jgi:hypothetical protein
MRDKWQARGKHGGTEFYLGTYRTPEEAAAVAHAWRLANLPGYTGRDITRGKADDVVVPDHPQGALFYIFADAGAA